MQPSHREIILCYGYPWFKPPSFGEHRLAEWLRRERRDLKPRWETLSHRPDPSSRRYRIVSVECRVVSSRR